MQKIHDAVGKHDNQAEETMWKWSLWYWGLWYSKIFIKRKIYLSSDYISNVKENIQGTFYFAKCSAKPSVQLQSYNVTCTLSLNSGFVVDASCMCVASAVSRCAHISGLLHLLLNESTCPLCHQTDVELQSDVPCTSKPKSWGQRKMRGHTPKPNMGPIKGENI